MRNLVPYFYAVFDKLLRFLWNTTANNNNYRGLVLMYHHITDEKINTEPTCVCGISKFKDIINNKPCPINLIAPIWKWPRSGPGTPTASVER